MHTPLLLFDAITKFHIPNSVRAQQLEFRTIRARLYLWSLNVRCLSVPAVLMLSLCILPMRDKVGSKSRAAGAVAGQE